MEGRPIHLFILRHSKSCSNYMRQMAGSEDRAHPLVRASQDILDPALSAVGRSMVEHYRPTLNQRLKAAGFDVDAATIGCSGLKRARETAQLLFPGRTVHHLPHIKEHGNIPENTPTNTKRCRPDWRAFLRHIAALPSSQFAVVGHGSFLKSEVWRSLSKKPHDRFHNLDGLLITAILTQDGDLLHPHIEEFKYRPPSYISGAADKCSREIEHKIVTHCKMQRMTKKWKQGRRQSKKQRGGSCLQQRNADSLAQIGGGVNMPLAYFQDGAQMRGTYAEPTGVGLAATSGSWVREALTQTGGARRHATSVRTVRAQSAKRKAQQGGFSPSIMGSFIANGSQLLPAAGYMGYRMFEKAKTRKGRRSGYRDRRERRSRRGDRN